MKEINSMMFNFYFNMHEEYGDSFSKNLLVTDKIIESQARLVAYVTSYLKPDQLEELCWMGVCPNWQDLPPNTFMPMPEWIEGGTIIHFCPVEYTEHEIAEKAMEWFYEN